MRYVFGLLLCIVTTLAHAQVMPTHDPVSAHTLPAQAQTMACCDEATPSAGSICATCVLPASLPRLAVASSVARQAFVIHDWHAADRRAAPPKDPPRRK